MLEYLNLPTILLLGLVLFIPMLLLILILMYMPRERTKYAMEEIKELIRAWKSGSKSSDEKP